MDCRWFGINFSHQHTSQVPLFGLPFGLVECKTFYGKNKFWFHGLKLLIACCLATIVLGMRVPGIVSGGVLVAW